MTLKEKVKQAFLAQAVADAFCFTYEFAKPELGTVFKHLVSPTPIYITDDTQMAMFGLYALGEWRRRPDAVRSMLIDHVRDAYLAWYRTQTGSVNIPRSGYTWLEEESRMRCRRAPGNTCMSALSSLSRGETVTNNSKGNGAVMRSLPFVFAPEIIGNGFSYSSAAGLASFAGELTHKHPESTIAVAGYMAAAHKLLRYGPSEFKPAVSSMRQAMKMGDTFTALPALIAAQAALAEAFHDRFDALLLSAATSGGDADTIAAIAGGLYGLVAPAPAELVNRLVERAIIERLVEWAVGEEDVRSGTQEVQSGSTEAPSGADGRGAMDG